MLYKITCSIKKEKIIVFNARTKFIFKIICYCNVRLVHIKFKINYIFECFIIYKVTDLRSLYIIFKSNFKAVIYYNYIFMCGLTVVYYLIYIMQK